MRRDVDASLKLSRYDPQNLIYDPQNLDPTPAANVAAGPLNEPQEISSRNPQTVQAKTQRRSQRRWNLACRGGALRTRQRSANPRARRSSRRRRTCAIRNARNSPSASAIARAAMPRVAKSRLRPSAARCRWRCMRSTRSTCASRPTWDCSPALATLRATLRRRARVSFFFFIALKPGAE